MDDSIDEMKTASRDASLLVPALWLATCAAAPKKSQDGKEVAR